jgi:ferredoxin
MLTNSFQNSSFDLVIVAGQNLSHWPSIGVKTLSRICTDQRLNVAWIGGTELRGIGVIPSENHGGVLFAEDAQKRIHRIETKALVRFKKQNETPPLFIGSFSAGVLPGSTAIQLLESESLVFQTSVALLGSGNKALQMGIRLLERNPNLVVHLIETQASWKGKRYAGWEVFRRRFESLGGKWIEGTPTALIPTHSSQHETYELKVKDSRGIRIIEVERVLSFGPYEVDEGYKEYPVGSLLFEIQQTAPESKDSDGDGFLREKSLAELLGVKISKLLSQPKESTRNQLDSIFKRSKRQWKSLWQHQDEGHHFRYQGKFLSTAELTLLKNFPGVPKNEALPTQKASIECIEKIECRICEDACPEKAIQISRLSVNPTFLIETDCTGCGACVVACPASIPVTLMDKAKSSSIQIGFSWGKTPALKLGETVELLNRRGENVGLGRVAEDQKVTETPQDSFTTPRMSDLVLIDVPVHLKWEARAIRKPKSPKNLDTQFKLVDSEHFLDGRVAITLNEEKRLVREGKLLTETLCETGYLRGEDQLFCKDGSCGLCQLEVDGIKQLACRTKTRKGMQIRLKSRSLRLPSIESYLCPCLGITSEAFRESIRNSKVSNPVTALNLTECGTGVCHGQQCLPNALQILREEELPFERFVDWRFPWVDWKIGGTLA